MLREGRDLTLFAYGSMVAVASEAAEKLRQRGIDCGVVNARFAKPLDLELLLQAVSDVEARPDARGASRHGRIRRRRPRGVPQARRRRCTASGPRRSPTSSSSTAPQACSAPQPGARREGVVAKSSRISPISPRHLADAIEVSEAAAIRGEGDMVNERGDRHPRGEAADRGTARLLRRRRARDRRRREGARGLRRTRLRPQGDHPQPLRRRRAAREGSPLRRGGRRGAGRRVADLLGARHLAGRARWRPGRSGCARSTPRARSSRRCTSRRSTTHGRVTRSSSSAIATTTRPSARSARRRDRSASSRRGRKRRGSRFPIRTGSRT